MTKFSQYLSPNLVIFSSTESRDKILLEMVNLLDEEGKLKDKELFYQAIMDREQLVSTGVGMGVAIPHAKLSEYNDFFITVCIHKSGVNWNALDHQPVRLIFMIGGPDDKQTDYLQILSSITFAIREEERRKNLLSCQTSEEVLALFSEL